MGTPGEIRKLDEVVVNRIAAGEVIQRPANALKELLENSLDASSSSIQVTLKNGGLKLLQIQDNGTGIRKEDLDIVCERFTTSKLRKFEDLGNIATFGFRGEALASISHVAHLTITTKTASELCAYKASYVDGKLKGPPKACAGNNGTLISVEDLFYNVPTRRKAFKSPSEEHSKVAEVICRYAVHNPSVGFTLKKHGDNLSDVKTNPGSTHVDNIRNIYGNNIARELLEVEAEDESLKFKMHGFISNVNYSTKKQTFILFINNRLVDSSALRKTIEGVYNLYLPKGSHPFLYMSLSLDPKNVDVNVHPTKHEVHFLHEDAIIESVRKAVEAKLLGSNTSRVFYTQAKLPGVNVKLETTVLEKSVAKTHAKELVRTDSSSQKIDKYLTPESELKPLAEKSKEDQTPSSRREITLTSILSLRSEVESSCNIALRELFANLTFVGCVERTKTLIQHSTKLYLVNAQRLMEELFYQIMLYDFGNFGIIKFQSPLPLHDLCLLGLEDPATGWKEEDGDKEDICKRVIEILSLKADMLQDYFSLEINDNYELCGIPLVLENYTPDISRLPNFILRLACDVDWTKEKDCFQGICSEIAQFYSFLPLGEEEDLEEEFKEQKGQSDYKWLLEHVVFPSIKKVLLPPKKFADDETILELANLPDLYKVFERC